MHSKPEICSSQKHSVFNLSCIEELINADGFVNLTHAMSLIEAASLKSNTPQIASGIMGKQRIVESLILRSQNETVAFNERIVLVDVIRVFARDQNNLDAIIGKTFFVQWLMEMVKSLSDIDQLSICLSCVKNIARKVENLPINALLNNLKPSTDVRVLALTADIFGNFVCNDIDHQQQVYQAEVLAALMPLLEHTNDRVIHSAVGAIRWLSFSNTIIQDDMYTQGGIALLVKILKICTNEHTLQLTADIFWNFAYNNKDHQQQVYQAGGLSVLIPLLENTNEEVIHSAVGAISFLSVDNTIIQDDMHTQGGIALLVKILKTCTHEHTLQVIADIFWNFVYENNDHQQQVYQAGGLAALMPLLERTNEDLLHNAVGAIRWLSFNNTIIQDDMYTQGGIALLVKILKTCPHKHSLKLATNIFCNFVHKNADHQHKVYQAGGLSALMSLLKHTHNSVVHYALFALKTFMYDRLYIMDEFVKHQGIIDLVRLLESSQHTEILNLSIRVLWALSAQSASFDNEIRESGGLSAIIRLLNHADKTILSSIAGALNCLFYLNSTNVYIVRTTGKIPLMMAALKQAPEMIDALREMILQDAYCLNVIRCERPVLLLLDLIKTESDDLQNNAKMVLYYTLNPTLPSYDWSSEKQRAKKKYGATIDTCLKDSTTKLPLSLSIEEIKQLIILRKDENTTIKKIANSLLCRMMLEDTNWEILKSAGVTNFVHLWRDASVATKEVFINSLQHSTQLSKAVAMLMKIMVHPKFALELKTKAITILLNFTQSKDYGDEIKKSGGMEVFNQYLHNQQQSKTLSAIQVEKFYYQLAVYDVKNPLLRQNLSTFIAMISSNNQATVAALLQELKVSLEKEIKLHVKSLYLLRNGSLFSNTCAATRSVPDVVSAVMSQDEILTNIAMMAGGELYAKKGMAKKIASLELERVKSMDHELILSCYLQDHFRSTFISRFFNSESPYSFILFFLKQRGLLEGIKEVDLPFSLLNKQISPDYGQFFKEAIEVAEQFLDATSLLESSTVIRVLNVVMYYVKHNNTLSFSLSTIIQDLFSKGFSKNDVIFKKLFSFENGDIILAMEQYMKLINTRLLQGNYALCSSIINQMTGVKYPKQYLDLLQNIYLNDGIIASIAKIADSDLVVDFKSRVVDELTKNSAPLKIPLIKAICDEYVELLEASEIKFKKQKIGEGASLLDSSSSSSPGFFQQPEDSIDEHVNKKPRP